MSVGELAMTPKISLVAGLLLQRLSVSSRNKRTFSIAMTAWSAKVSRSLICTGVKGRTSMRRAPRVPMSSAWSRRGAAKKVRHRSLAALINGKLSCARMSGTWSVPCSRIQRCRGSSMLIAIPLERYRTKMGALNHRVALTKSQHHVINAANPCGAFDDGVEHRLHVRGRAADNAEHLGRCGLMLQCLGAILRLRSAISINNRTFSMAITAWSAKVLRRAICCLEKGANLETTRCEWYQRDTPLEAMAPQDSVRLSPKHANPMGKPGNLGPVPIT